MFARTATHAGRSVSYLKSRSAHAGRSLWLPQTQGQLNQRRLLSYPAHEIVGMPSLSPTMEAGTIASWKVNEGDSFSAGDVFCSVETDKATVDFEAQDDGVVAKIIAPAGPQEIRCGEPILVTVATVDDVAAFSTFTLSSALSSVATSGSTEKPSAPSPAPPVATTPETSTSQTTVPSVPVVTTSNADSRTRIFASPLAHFLAKELGHNITSISGTGPGGRVIAADVKEYVPDRLTISESLTTTSSVSTAAAPPPAGFAAPASVAGAGYTDFPISEAARQIAAQLTFSKQRVPHYYLTVDIAMAKLLDLRSTLNSGIGEGGNQLGVYELLLKAAAVSMKTVPSVNASWMDSVVRVYDSVDINVVIGDGDALYTPLIRDCGSLGLKSISKALTNAVTALDGDKQALGMDFASVGTFTVMNLGMYGIKSCAPIIREPQSCALAFGALENRIVPNDVVPTNDEPYKQCVMMTATLSCDHRVVDGAVGAQWLSAFKAHVENPATLLL